MSDPSGSSGPAPSTVQETCPSPAEERDDHAFAPPFHRRRHDLRHREPNVFDARLIDAERSGGRCREHPRRQQGVGGGHDDELEGWTSI